MSGPHRAYDDERFRISPTQARLVMRLGDRVGSRRTRVEARLRRDVDLDRLARALTRIAARHDALRTRIAVDATTGAAVQIVSRPTEVTIERGGSAAIDGDAASRSSEADLIARVFAREGGSVLHLDLPAATVDARSACLVVDEIAHAYGDRPLRDDIAQYPDITEWQWQVMEGADGDAGRAFWRRHAGFPIPNGTLPLASPRASVAPDETLVRLDALDADVVAGLRRLATPDAPVGLWMSAALGALVHRLTDTAALVIGHLADGRRYQELEPVVGALARLVPVPMELRGDDSLTSLVARSADRVRAAYEWQEAFAWNDHADAPPSLPLAFAHVDIPALPANGPFERIESLNAWHETADLALTVLGDGASEDGIVAHWSAAAAWFSDADVAWLARAYRTLLAAAVADPHRRIASIDLVDAEARRLILDRFNDSARDVGEGRAVHALFLAHAAATPEAVAVDAGDRTWTYEQLAHGALAIAAALRARSLRSEEVVAVCAGHSFELLAAIVGVLCADAAFLPIDPATPRQRIASLCTDAGVRVLLTDAASRAAAPYGDLELLDIGTLIDASSPDAALALPIGGPTATAGDATLFRSYFLKLHPKKSNTWEYT